MGFNISKIVGDVKTSTKSEVKLYSKTNPMAGRVASDYEPRETYYKTHHIPQLQAMATGEGFTAGEYRGIFDQSIVIQSTLDVPLNVRIGPTGVPSISQLTGNYAYLLEMGDIKVGHLSTQMLTMVPESSYGINLEIQGKTIRHVPELRQAWPGFYLVLQTATAPTQGEIKILVSRRF